MSPSLFALLDNLPGRLCEFAAGEQVFHFGDPIRNIHAVRSGVIHLIRRQDNGSILILQRAERASILAEASIYSAQYHCDARAETTAVTWAMPRSALRARLQQDPDLAAAWARHLAREVQQARLQAEILFLKTVAARLDAWIAWHGRLPAKGHWSVVAQEIGVSPEALYRELARRRASKVPA